MPHVKGAVAALAVLSLVHPAASQNAGKDRVVQNDTYFYGQSPPVYPTPEMSGVGGWDEALSKAQKMVSQMSLEEKVSLTGGYKNSSRTCGGNIPAISRLGFPGMCLQDGPAGVRGTEGVNGYPSGVHIGASWNKSLAYERSHAMAGEFKAVGATVSLGPAVIGPLGRITRGGRNFEGFSVDPYLSGVLGAQSVKGTQDRGVISCTKHFVGNEQETHRFEKMDPVTNHSIEASSSNIDDRTMHEMYMWPFVDAVHAGAASIMCSYERLNNSYACQNSKALNGLLKTELGFQGFVMTDWVAQKSGVASALAGLDMAMPYGSEFWGQHLVEAVHNGSVPESFIENKVIRIITAWYYSHQDDPSLPPVATGLSDLSSPHTMIDARDPDDAHILMEGAIQGHVLVKNEDKALPLTKPRMLAIYGYDAKTPERNNPDEIRDWDMGFESHDYDTVSCGFGPYRAMCHHPFAPIANGTLMGGAGSGAITPFYIDGPLEALQARARQNGTQLFWDTATNNSNSSVPGATDACLVFINSFASEGVDRPNLRDDYSDALVKNIAGQCKNTIVTVHNAGIRLLDQWIDHPNVTAVILAHLPGQDSGTAITQLLYGEVSPSGKLPYTIARDESDYGNIVAPQNAHGWDRYFPQDNFTDGVFIDYRAFDENNIEPRFEFGFGLSYTNFNYSNLKIMNTINPSTQSTFPVGHVIPGGHSDLFDTVATVTADITNTGDVPAAEVGQLYVTIPSAGQPVRQLRGFDKVRIHPGETKTVKFELRRRDLSVWDVTVQQWRLLTGSEYPLSVGASSRQLLLNGTLAL